MFVRKIIVKTAEHFLWNSMYPPRKNQLWVSWLDETSRAGVLTSVLHILPHWTDSRSKVLPNEINQI
jgi:hypothetical protein